MSRTGIQWTDEVWNPVRGCRRLSPGCEHCYAEREAMRKSGPGGAYEGLVRLGKSGPQWTGEGRFVPGKLSEPLRWRRPRMVFVNSMSDLFYEAFTNEQIAAVFGVMAVCPQHTFQVLTKRPTRARAFFTWLHGQVPDLHMAGAWCSNHLDDRHPEVLGERVFLGVPWPLPNVWLVASVEDQQRAEERLDDLLACPAAIHGVSYEPALGRVDCDLHRLNPSSPRECARLVGKEPHRHWLLLEGPACAACGHYPCPTPDACARLVPGQPTEDRQRPRNHRTFMIGSPGHHEAPVVRALRAERITRLHEALLARGWKPSFDVLLPLPAGPAAAQAALDGAALAAMLFVFAPLGTDAAAQMGAALALGVTVIAIGEPDAVTEYHPDNRRVASEAEALAEFQRLAAELE